MEEFISRKYTVLEIINEPCRDSLVKTANSF